MSDESRPVVVVHLADLHLGLRLGTTQDAAHDVQALIALDQALNQLEWDLLVISGDLTADADQESFAHLKDWLKRERHLPGGVTIGLNLASRPDRKVVVVPGNRDRPIRNGRQQTLENFHALFPVQPPSPSTDESPQLMAVALNAVEHLDIRGFPINVLALDSSRENEKEWDGYVDLTQIVAPAPDPHAFNIAVVHHNLYPAPNRAVLRNARDVLSYLVARHTDAVLFGHTHRTELSVPPLGWIARDRRKRRGTRRRMRKAFSWFLAFFGSDEPEGDEEGDLYKRATCKNGNYPTMEAYFEYLYLRYVEHVSVQGPSRFQTPRDFHQYIIGLRSGFQSKQRELRRQRCILSMAPSPTETGEQHKGFNVFKLEAYSGTELGVTLIKYVYDQGKFTAISQPACSLLLRDKALNVRGPFKTRPAPNPPPKSTSTPRHMNILHLTDLHFGVITDKWTSSHYWNSRESTEWQYPERDRRGLVESLVADLPNISGRPETASQVDLVIVSGDILDRAQPEGVPLAQQFFRSLMARLGLPSKRIIFAPGNHDVERSESDERYRLFAEVWNSVHETSFHNIESQLYAQNPVRRFWFDELETEVVSFNSCVRMDASNNYETGGIGRNQLDMARQRLRASQEEARYRIAVMHHHLTRPQGQLPRQDLSEIEDAQEVVAWLAENRFHLVLHGHEHVDWQEERLINGWGLCIVAGASAGVGRYGREEWTLPLGYQLITMEDNTSGKRLRRVYVPHVRRWQSAPGNSVEPLHFGAYLAKANEGRRPNRSNVVVPPKGAPLLGNATPQRKNIDGRRLLTETFPTKSLLEGFFIDNFPDTARQLDGKDYDDILNIALKRHQPHELWQVLSGNAQYRKRLLTTEYGQQLLET